MLMSLFARWLDIALTSQKSHVQKRKRADKIRSGVPEGLTMHFLFFFLVKQQASKADIEKILEKLEIRSKTPGEEKRISPDRNKVEIIF